MNITLQIQARLGSTRLPGKVLYPLGPRRVLGWVAERMRCVEKSAQIIFTVGDRPENKAICEWCDRNRVTYSIGSEDDLLERHYQAAEMNNSDTVVRITGDCPFIPPSEIDRVIQEHNKNDAEYTTNFSEKMPVGTAVDAIDIKTLSKLREQGDSHPVRRLRNNPKKWNTVITPNEQWTAFSDVHMAVDTPEDYWSLSDAVNEVGSEPRAVAKWLQNNKT
jgi:spore coat polysaccharide biosynthesis protein SpsF